VAALALEIRFSNSGRAPSRRPENAKRSWTENGSVNEALTAA